MSSVRVMLSRKKRHWVSLDTHRGGSCSLGTLLVLGSSSVLRGRARPGAALDHHQDAVTPACLMTPEQQQCPPLLLLSGIFELLLSQVAPGFFQISKQVLAKKCWAPWVNPVSRDSSCGKQKGAQFHGTGICSAWYRCWEGIDPHD